MTAMLLVRARKCQQCRCHKKACSLYTRDECVSACVCVKGFIGCSADSCMNGAKLFSNRVTSVLKSFLCFFGHQCWWVCACVYVCVYSKHVHTGEFLKLTMTRTIVHTCVKTRLFLQVCTCFVFPVSQWGWSLTQCSLYATVCTPLSCSLKQNKHL